MSLPMRVAFHRRQGQSLLFVALATLAGTAAASPALLPDGGGAEPLSSIPVPRPANLRDFVKNDQAAVVLGKALFWDSQVGGDGVQACATCHFSSGGDPRTLNTTNPGPNGIFDEAALGGQLSANRFPFQSDDRAGSQGLVDTNFNNIVRGSAVDNGTPTPNATVFLNEHQVTGRNTPTSINSVFNIETFWDGRAKNIFNGRTPGGADPTALLIKVGSGGSISRVSVQIRNSAAASQSVGPPNNGVEMSFEGRTFFDLGKKMLSVRPLATQQVASDDSVFASFRDSSGTGLNKSYADLVSAAIQDTWWNSDAIVDRNLNVIGHGTPSGLDQFSVMEANFSLFWGLSVQMYMSTLTSGDSPFDRFAKGNSNALNSLQKSGLNLFGGKANCTHCHTGPMFTDIASRTDRRAFVKTGVRPVAEDGGRAGSNGKFKTSTVRNTELTGPYFHNGGYGTLRQVVDFYDRGGDFPNDELDNLGLSDSQKTALVAFLLSTTDDRVRFQRAPFDHPSLSVPNGTSIPAVGRNGGAEIHTFLGLDPFDDSTGSLAMVVDPQGAQPPTPGTRELNLVSYANHGKEFRLFASVGDTLALPKGGVAAPSQSQLRKLLFKGRRIQLVTSGTLDDIGTASVAVDVPSNGLGGAVEYFFTVVDPATDEVLALSGAGRLSAAP